MENLYFCAVQVRKINDVVLIHEEKLTRKTGVVEEIILRKDHCVRGAIVRVPRNKSLITSLVNKLFQVETIHDCVDVNK